MLIKIELNNGLQEIQGEAFRSLRNVTELVIPGSVRTFGASLFDGISSVSPLPLLKFNSFYSIYNIRFCIISEF